jgi:hypothetical protein
MQLSARSTASERLRLLDFIVSTRKINRKAAARQH